MANIGSGWYPPVYGVTSSLVAWLWDFGDGATSTLQNPTHVYSIPVVGHIDAYTVSLTVTSSSGATDTETKLAYITTVPVPSTLYGSVALTETVAISTHGTFIPHAAVTVTETVTIQTAGTFLAAKHGQVALTETVTITTHGVFLPPVHGRVELTETVTVTTSATATLHGAAGFVETVTLTTHGQHFGLGVMPPAAEGDFALTPVAGGDFALTPVSTGDFVLTPVSSGDFVLTPLEDDDFVLTPVG